MTVRVRFAPSPTGYLHIGNARAALINYLFTKSHKGEFILRLDDTDKERSSEEYAKAIQENLNWLGLHYDFFFKQSERSDRYNDVINNLKQQGRLYPCYETPEELEFKRKRQLGRGKPPLYDQSSLKLTQEQIRNFEREGRVPHWRFLLNKEKIQWHDLIRENVAFDPQSLSDPVLIRADGVLLYSLASVIDDIDYGITHIIRGEDHVTNTATQLQLFEALGKNPQEFSFAHTTLLVDTSGHGFSKRLGGPSLQNLADIEPMAINSLLARIGTSLPIEPHLTLEELIQTFDLRTFSRTPPKFDLKELQHLNRKLLHITPFSMIQKKAPYWLTQEIWDVLKGNIDYTKDLEHWHHVLFGDITLKNCDPNLIKIALEHLPKEPWTTDTWQQWAEQLKNLTNLKGKNLFLRLALTGLEHGPEMKKLLPLIGYKRVKKRLQNVHTERF